MTDFVPGLDLAEGYYRDVVGPLLAGHYDGVKHGAALMGGGSDVLGYDTAASMDHDWGPRCQLFFPDGTSALFLAEVAEFLRRNLPVAYQGFPTHFAPKRENEPGVKIMTAVDQGPVDHMIEVTTPAAFVERRTGLDAARPLSERDWLILSNRSLLAITAGRIFHDDVGLDALRRQFQWYPRDVWIFLMGCAWWRMRRLERSLGHSGMVGDELGAQVQAGRLVRDFMRLAFLMERTYAPYSKWFGRGFQDLPCAEVLGPQLEALLSAKGFEARDTALAAASQSLGEMHNRLGITQLVPAQSRPALDRPYRIIWMDKFARACFREVQSPYLGGLFRKGVVGNVEFLTDSVDVVISTHQDGRALKLYDPD